MGTNQKMRMEKATFIYNFIYLFSYCRRIRKLRKKHNGDMLVSFADPRTYETDTNIII